MRRETGREGFRDEWVWAIQIFFFLHAHRKLCGILNVGILLQPAHCYVCKCTRVGRQRIYVS